MFHIKVPALILGALLLCSFSLDEKVLCKLHEKGERAFAKNDLIAAMQAYEELLDNVSINAKGSTTKYGIDWPTYIDLVVRLGTVYHKCELFIKGEALLAEAMAKDPPIDFLLCLVPERARHLVALKQPFIAHHLFHQLNQAVSLSRMTREDASFYKGLCYMLKAELEALVQEGEGYFLKGEYAWAIPLFKQAYEGVLAHHFPTNDPELEHKLATRLAEAHFYLGAYETAFDYLEFTSAPPLLHALVCERLGNYELASISLEKGLRTPQKAASTCALALIEMKQDLFEQAKKRLKKLESDADAPVPEKLIRAAIAIQENQPFEATDYLEECPLFIENAHTPLKHYLEGQVAFLCQRWQEASTLFDTAGPWHEEATLFRGLCLLQLASDPLKNASIKQRYFDKADHLFRSLINTSEHERALVALATSSVKQNKRPDGSAPYFPTLSTATQAQILLLQIEGASSYEEREALFERLCHTHYQYTSCYGKGWATRGAHFLAQALELEKKHPEYFEKAMHAFKVALSYDPHMEAKKGLAYALFWRDTPATRHACYQLINSLNTSDPDLLLLLGHLCFKDDGVNRLSLAKSSFERAYEGYFDEERKAHTQFCLATTLWHMGLKERANELFSTLASSFPNTPQAPYALFAAKEMRKVWKRYPDCPLAPEAYLRTFSQDDYLLGNKEALAHLKAFPKEYERSVFSIASAYFLGLAYKNVSPKESVTYFTQAFTRENAKKEVTERLIHYRSLLECAALLVDQEEIEKALMLVEQVIKDHAGKSDGFPEIYQEALFQKALCHIATGDVHQGRALFSKMLIAYDAAGITQSKMLARLWLEEGKLAMQEGLLDKALRCFTFIESCQENTLSKQECLSIWMLESSCLRGLGKFAEAMLKLSFVINDDSASLLRIEAMMQRAELYELAGRHQLAKRQLQAVAKKGGKTGKVAQVKLEEKYGVQ